MSEWIDFYHKQVEANLSSYGWLADYQQKSWLNVKATGFPTRHHEHWKYTNVTPLLAQSFLKRIPQEQPLSDFPASVNLFSQQLSSLSAHGKIYNAEALPARIFDNIPSKPSKTEKFIILPLAEAFKSHASCIQSCFDRVLNHEHAFHDLNTALLDTGFFIYIPAHTKLSSPILLEHYTDQAQASYLRHVVILEEGAEATLLEVYQGEASKSYFTNHITEIQLGENARLDHYTIQNESKEAYHISHVATLQAASSQFNSHSISLGGKLTRADIQVKLEGKGALCLLNGMYLPQGKQHVDHHTVIQHLVPECSSTQDYKGILNDSSRAVFNGKVYVERQAHHTIAKQSNKNIMLSAHAEVDTKPELEIFADDIACSHGATVGQLDEDALFYLATRGIPLEEAKQYLISAFIYNNLSLISHDIIRQGVEFLIKQQLR